jgi:hypothetical protein
MSAADPSKRSLAPRAADAPGDPLAGDARLRAGLVGWLVVLFAILLRASWLRWGDPIVDIGRELEIPWKVAAGQWLYRDMAYNYGPLSPMLHGLLLKLFGVQLGVIVWSGVLGAALGTILVWRTCRTLAPSLAACAITAVFLMECAFQHYMPNGIFNFVLPYSFPAVHGMLLALGAFLALSSWIDGRGPVRLALAGALTGLSALCKIEVAFAIAVPLALVPLLAARAGGARRRLVEQLAWAGPAAAVLGLGLLPFVSRSSVEDVIWRNVLRPQLVDVRSNLFFMTHLGLADLGTNLGRIALSLAAWTLTVVLVALGAAWVARPAARGRRLAGLALLAATAVAAWAWFGPGPQFAGLSVLALAAAVHAAARLIGRGRPADPGMLRRFALALFGALALLRMFLTAGTFHYGFYLAVPALILLGIVLLVDLPRAVPALRRVGPAYGVALSCLLVLLSCRSFWLGSMHYYRQKTLELTGAQGRLRISPEPYGVTPGAYLQDALRHLHRAGRAGDTLLVLPEGATINFLSGQMNPTYYDVLIPPELEAPGVEDALIAQLEARRVTRILFVERTVAEYGRRGLGLDYGVRLMRHIGEHYVTEATFGPPPYGPQPGGCAVLRRRDVD